MKSLTFNLSLLSCFVLSIFFGCTKSSDSSNSPNSPNSSNTSNNQKVVYKGTLIGSTGYLTGYLNLNLQGSGSNGTNKSFILVSYIDSSQSPLKIIKDSLTTSSLSNWQPGKAIANAIFTGLSGITVTLVSINSDGSNPVTSMTVPNDPFVKSLLEMDTVSSSPLLVFMGKAVPVSTGCPCYTKTINFIINPAYIGNSSAAATAIYVDSYTQGAGFLTAKILSSAPNVLTQIINNNDITGLFVYNGPGGPNSNNGSGPVSGTLQISTDGSTLSGNISGMYNPNNGVGQLCGCSYTVTAKKFSY